MSKDKRVVNIHGKDYETVASRVERFRKEKDYSIETELLQNNETIVVMKAIIRDGDRILATGHAEEKRNSSQINRTSALENCETSAIGRCLACLGYIGTEFASADEVANAIHQQSTKTAPTQPTQTTKPAAQDKNVISDKQVGFFFGKGKEFGWATEELKELIKTFGYESTKNIKRDDFKKIIEMVEKGIPGMDKTQADRIADLEAETKKNVDNAADSVASLNTPTQEGDIIDAE